MKNILFICTSNKDRSPALSKYFAALFPHHSYKSAGVNRFFTKYHNTHYLTISDLKWANIIVYAEDVHYQIVNRDFSKANPDAKDCYILNFGNFNPRRLKIMWQRPR